MTRRFGWLSLFLLLTTLLFACSEGGTPTRQIDFIPLSSIELQSANDQITVGTSNQFTAIGHYGTAPGIQFTRDVTAQVAWSSSNNGVLSVSNNTGTEGLGTAGVAGTTTVTAELDGITASLDFTVNSESISALQITEQNSEMSAGTTLQLHAVGTFPDGTSQDLTNAVTWASDSPAVATVSNKSPYIGQVSAINEGQAQISASFDGIAATTIVTVSSAALDSIDVVRVDAIEPTDSPFIAEGTTLQLKAYGNFTSGASAQDLTDQVSWSSDNKEVATVSVAAGMEGLVTAVAPGTANISASFRNLAGTLPVTVSEATIIGLQINPQDGTTSIKVGDRVNWTVTGTFSDGNKQDLTRDVVWSQDDPTVAVVSNADGQEGTIRGLAVGNTNIRATYNEMSDIVNLTVTAQ